MDTTPRHLNSLNSMSPVKMEDVTNPKMTSRINLMLLMDVAGATGGEIAEAVGYTQSWVSTIRHSPMYAQQREQKWAEMKNKVLEKKSDSVVAGDPVEIKMKELAVSAVREYENLLAESNSDMVRKSTADAILDRAGYKPHTEKTKVTVEVTEKMANRFEKVLNYDEPNKNAGQAKIRVTQEMS